MAHITKEQVVAACEMGRKVFAGYIDRKSAAENLHKDLGINLATANDFINCYRHLMNGKVFHRAMSASAMEYFMASIHDAHGIDALPNAVKALRAHIEYWENHYKTKVIKLRKIANDYQQLCESHTTEDEYQRAFESEVKKSLSDSPASRRERLVQANPIPTKKLVEIAFFARNPDVVAEVLLRAGGYCERCKKRAPFLRAKDKTPYLEVHHVVQLAHGGKDTVDNATALCPNCHRELHYGEASFTE